ncbi:general substrate transporter [Thozetella sp. PMI_491]|nr:general substrate transporter [Thozetella sp. PMI_491]
MTTTFSSIFRGRFRDFNGTIVFIMLYMSACSFNFGYDVGNFSGVQGMQSFAKKFGEYSPSTNTWDLPGWLSSLMTSIPFLGKALGAVACGPIAEKWGRKTAILILIVLSFIGVLLQTTATTAAQFTLGRVVSFGMTGFTIVIVPIYQSETAPKSVRGMLNSMLQMMIIFGHVFAALIILGTKGMESDAGWRIPVSIQFIPPAIILAFYPLVPESPRWLLATDRIEDAKKSLRRINKALTNEELDFEIEALRHANSNESKGPWPEVFDSNNRIRTIVAILAMLGSQITGQAFISQYNVIFYQQQGFRSQAFAFNLISPCLGIFCLILTWFLVDAVGRRPLLYIGGTLMAAFLFIVGGISAVPQPTYEARQAMVACFIMFGAAYNLSWGPISFVVVAEAAASRVKEKTNLLACAISVLFAFITSFTIPYLMNANYAGLGGKIGFIYGSINVLMVIATYFYIPELKGRSLEEVDQLFASGAPLRKFKSIEITPLQESSWRQPNSCCWM